MGLLPDKVDLQPVSSIAIFTRGVRWVILRNPHVVRVLTSVCPGSCPGLSTAGAFRDFVSNFATAQLIRKWLVFCVRSVYFGKTCLSLSIDEQFQQSLTTEKQVCQSVQTDNDVGQQIRNDTKIHFQLMCQNKEIKEESAPGHSGFMECVLQ